MTPYTIHVHVHAMKSKIFVIDSLLHNGSTVDEGLRSRNVQLQLVPMLRLIT